MTRNSIILNLKQRLRSNDAATKEALRLRTSRSTERAVFDKELRVLRRERRELLEILGPR